MQLFPLNPFSPISFYSLSLPRTFAVHSKSSIPDIPRVGAGAAGGADQSIFQLLLSIGFGSTCRTGFLLAGPPFKTQPLP